MVPGLLKSLRDGLSSSAFDPFATSEFFSELEALHVQVLERSVEVDQATPMVEVSQQIVLQTADEGSAVSTSVRTSRRCRIASGRTTAYGQLGSFSRG
jgi:hypothetical protein